MTRKTLSIVFVLAVVIEVVLGDPTPPHTPFESRNMDQHVDFLLKTTIHKFDARKVPVIEARVKQFLEALDMLIDDAGNDDGKQTTMYKNIRSTVAESLRAIQEDTPTCGIYLVAMSKLGHITSLVAHIGDPQLWTYWTLSNIDEKTLFVSVGYPLDNVDEYEESKVFFAKNEGLFRDAKTKANDFVNDNCHNYKLYYQDSAISY